MIKSILKWPGSKTHLIPQIDALLPEGKRLVEPFVGSASLFMNIDKYEYYVLNDINPILSRLYYYTKYYPTEFISLCKSYFIDENNTPEKYSKIRDEFNLCCNKVHMDASAKFLYLNRHCFNGLVRFNKKGEFNSPFGLYKNPYFPEKELIFFHKKSSNNYYITVSSLDFRHLKGDIIKGDVVYCDPPYIPLSDTAKFTSYSSNSFTMKDHVDLAIMANTLRDIGIPVLISNHDTPITRELYKNASKIVSVEVSRRISCKADSRKPAKELLALFV